MIRHILLIAFKPGTQPAQIDAVRTAFLAIPHQVSGVTAVEWGRDDSPEGRADGVYPQRADDLRRRSGPPALSAPS